MRKYLYVYAISLQNVLQRRSSLIMDRVGGIAVTVAMYFFWASLFAGAKAIPGYSRETMLCYVLMMNLLRSFVFTGRGWEVVGEIASGRLSNYLLRPIRYLGWCLASDMSQKTVHLAAAVLEVGALVWIFKAPWIFPGHAAAWIFFAAAMLLSSLLFFLVEFCVASLAFWTSESGGPLFCFELAVQFMAGAFFPIDVLPRALQAFLRTTPFPYMVFFPIHIYLGRMPASEAVRILGVQIGWLAAAGLAALAVWRRGIRAYAAEGG